MRPSSIRTVTLCLTLAAVAFGLGVASAPDPLAADEKPARAEPGESAEPAGATTDELSYTLGYVISHRLAAMGVELDVPAFADGFKTARSDAPLRVSEARMQELLDTFTEKRRAKADDGKPEAEDRDAEAKRKAMAEQMQQRPINAPPPSSTYLRIDGQVPKGRIDAAVGVTQRVTREADAPEVREQR